MKAKKFFRAATVNRGVLLITGIAQSIAIGELITVAMKACPTVPGKAVVLVGGVALEVAAANALEQYFWRLPPFWGMDPKDYTKYIMELEMEVLKEEGEAY